VHFSLSSFQAIPQELQRTHGFAVITDADTSGAPLADLPSPTTAGVLDAPRDKDGKVVKDGEDPIDGDAAFSRTGWAPRFGWPDQGIHESESLLDHTTWLEESLPDKFYGGELSLLQVPRQRVLLGHFALS